MQGSHATTIRYLARVLPKSYKAWLALIMRSTYKLGNLPMHSKLAASLGMLAAYLMVRYKTDAKVRVFTSKNTRLTGAMKALGELFASYSPTIYLPGPLMKDILNTLGKPPHFSELYTRQTLELADKEVIALDWYPKHPDSADHKDLPVIVMLPGTASHSCSKTVETFVKSTKNFRVLVINRRGFHGMPIKGSRISPFDSYSDFHEILIFVRKQFPEVNIYLLGASMGSCQLINYAGIHGERAVSVGGVQAGFFIAPTWDGPETLRKISKFGLADQSICKHLKMLYTEQLKGEHYRKLLQEKGVKEGKNQILWKNNFFSIFQKVNNLSFKFYSI